MFRCFVDDSGRDYQGPALVLGGWVARVDDWDEFSDVWDARLGLGKSIEYFKHTEAINQKGCFAGFSEQQAAEKMVGLARALIGRPIAGFTCSVSLPAFKEHVQDKAVSRKGRLPKELTDPFYIAFSDYVPFVYGHFYHSGVRDKIDFIIDGNQTDKALRRCSEIFRGIKADYEGHPWHPLMGEIIPGDDKDLPPLQAADLLAGQVRRVLVDLAKQPILQMYARERVPLNHLDIGEEKLVRWRGIFDKHQATNILAAIKAEREGEGEREG